MVVSLTEAQIRALRNTELYGGFARGGAEGNRTLDLRSAIAALSHLSYGPARLAIGQDR